MLTITLVRHGEVFNPNHVVYGDLPGFDLSPRGAQQAHQVGEYLSPASIDLVLSSPLTRARHTASAISFHHEHISVTVDPRLTEFRMYPEWTGRTWDEVRRLFPDEVRGYLADATTMPGASESVTEMLGRMRASVADAVDDGFRSIVVVGHQDPIQALRLGLVGRPLSDLRKDPPGHASATTIESDDGVAFREVSIWNPTTADL
jgi:broad specificity phosphatase PhoE